MAAVEEGNGVAEDKMTNYAHVVRCRGLPWSAQREDMIRFFHDCQVQEIFFGKDHTGRASGEAFVAMSSEEDVTKAQEHNNEHMTKRYIEVYKSSAEELDWFRRRNSRAQLPRDGVVHLRGLPYGCVETDLEDFFREFSLGPNGMVLIMDGQGRTTGDAYVQFSSPTEAGNAIQKRHMKKMGHRYLELFPSSMEYAQRALVSQEEKNLYGYSDSFGGRRGGRGGPVRTHQSGGRTAPYARPGMHAGEGMGGGGYDFQGRYPQQSAMGSGYNNMSSMGFGRGNGGGFGRGSGFGSQTGGFGDYGGNAGVGFGNNNVGNGGSGFGGFNRNAQMGFNRQQPQQGYGTENSANLGGGGDAFQAAVMAAAAGVMSRQGIGSNPGQGSVVVHMRGLPYSATVQDIYEFFGTPPPVQVDLHYKDNGQATGEADAIFSTHEHAMTAMGKNGQHMGARYIELFLK